MSRRILDSIAGWLGYAPAHKVTAAYWEGRNEGSAVGHRLATAAFQGQVAVRCGQIEAERNGYRAQFEQAQRRLRVANHRLQRADLMPVTSFIAG